MDLQLEHKYSKAIPIMTISQGICFGIPEMGDKIRDYLRGADHNLYVVKRQCRNSYQVGRFAEQIDEIESEKSSHKGSEFT